MTRHESPSYRTLLLLFTIGCLFVASRSLNTAQVVFPSDGDILLLGVDANFHVRHAAFSAAHFPTHLRGDPASHYPGIEHQQVTGLYNLGIAFGALLLNPVMDQRQALLWSASLSPLVLGLATMLLIFLIIRRVASDRTALTACLLFLLFPGQYLTKSSLGFADQHTLEVFMSVWAVWALVRAWHTDPGMPSGRRWRRRLTGAFPFALLSWSWIGYPLLLGLLGVPVIIVIILWMALGHSGQGLREWAATLALAATLMISLNLAVPNYRMALLDGIWQWSAAGLGVLSILSAFSGWFVARQAPPFRRMGAALGVALAIIALVWLFRTEHRFGDAFWFWLTSVRGANVSEQRAADLGWISHLFAIPIILSVVGLIRVVMQRSPWTDRQASMLLIQLSAAAMLLIWIRTRDFDYLPAAFMALSASLGVLAVGAGLTRIGNRWRSDSPGFFPTGVGTADMPAIFVAVMALGAVKAGWIMPPWISQEQGATLQISNQPWAEAMDWMHERTPTPSITPLADTTKTGPWERSAYGVMAAWDHGNFIAWRGERLPVASRYPSPRDARWLTATRETEADSLLCQGCQGEENVRFAVVSWKEPTVYFRTKMQEAGRQVTLRETGSWQRNGKVIPRISFGASWENAMMTRMTKYNGSGLGHYRLVWESTERRLQQTVFEPEGDTVFLTSDILPIGMEGPPINNDVLTEINGRYAYDVHVTPAVRIFESVPGVLLRGHTRPGITVTAENIIEVSSRNRRYLFFNRALVDSTGNFEVRVPYSALQAALSPLDSIGTIAPWRMIIGSDTSYLRQFITPEMILNGDTVLVGTF